MNAIRHIVRCIGTGILVTAASTAFAGSQQFQVSAPQNGSTSQTYYFSAPATCNISSSVVFNNPIQPSGGGGGGVTVELINVRTVQSFGYGGNMSGSASRFSPGEPAGNYKIDLSASAGGTGVTCTSQTTFSW